MSLCKYRDIFGKPHEGVHKYRMGNYALFDIVGTIVGGWLLARGMGWDVENTILVLFLVGILAHWMFCVNTALNVELGLGYVEKREIPPILPRRLQRD